ncbi:sugar phosphate nucleotidyltransferase [Alphaproteobacteria bacterium]|nr:sugar phosphate nucleotidyltransferase [Alphaproteobacteria bacterium]
MTKNVKGILLAAGNGTRLMPATLPISKPLLPLYDKPMIYYPLETLIRLNIKDILFIVKEEHIPIFQKTFGTGEEVGLTFQYQIQKVPKGISDAYFIAKDFLEGSDSVLALSDNVFLGEKYFEFANDALRKMQNIGASVFGLAVSNPENFGVIELNSNNKIIGIEEKPIDPKSNLIIPGLYFFDSTATKLVQQLKPSSRGELEITDLIKIYLDQGQLDLQILDNLIQWHDTGTAEAILEASNSVKKYEKKYNKKVGSYHIAAYEMGLISKEQLTNIADKFIKADYGQSIKKYLDIN